MIALVITEFLEAWIKYGTLDTDLNLVQGLLLVKKDEASRDKLPSIHKSS